jgi:hypothetical protein
MAAEWYYTTNKTQMGPVSWPELRELADVGILKPHDMVWSDGMVEWVKAINQGGLFAEEAESKPSSRKKAAAFTEPAKPPPARRTRRREDEDDDDEEDERETKKRNRKREQERAKAGVGIKVGLILGGVFIVLMLLVCAGGGLIWLSTRGGAPVQQVQGGVVANNVGNGGGRVVSYTINNLAQNPKGGNFRTENFQQGKRVVITVTNNLRHPNTDVDLYVYQGNQRMPLVSDIRTPPQHPHCHVEFIVPVTGPYQIRVVNLGPFSADSCAVRIEEN